METPTMNEQTLNEKPTTPEQADKQSYWIHVHLKQMITDGCMIIRSLSSVDEQRKEEFLWVRPDCHVHAKFTGEFGRKLWAAAQFWGLDTTKRYTRRKKGIVVDDYLLKALDEAIAAGK